MPADLRTSTQRHNFSPVHDSCCPVIFIDVEDIQATAQVYLMQKDSFDGSTLSALLSLRPHKKISFRLLSRRRMVPRDVRETTTAQDYGVLDPTKNVI